MNSLLCAHIMSVLGARILCLRWIHANIAHVFDNSLELQKVHKKIQYIILISEDIFDNKDNITYTRNIGD